MLDLAKKVIKLTASKSEIAFKPLPDDDPRQRKPDISKAQKYMGWKPRISLEDGLKKTIAYFSALIGGRMEVK